MKIILLAILLIVWEVGLSQVNLDWAEAYDGIQFVQTTASIRSEYADNLLTIVKVDPQKVDVEIASAKMPGEHSMTAENWARKKGYVLTVNAGMFGMDGNTNVGYMRIGQVENNPSFSKENAFWVAMAMDSTLPGSRVVDRTCEDWQRTLAKYKYVTQGIRMIDCKGKNQWTKQAKRWSMVWVASDTENNLFFIFARSPYAVHDMIEMVLKLNLNLNGGLYLEGGPEASLSLDTPHCYLNLFGSFETGFFESDENDRSWPIPNVIGVKVKAGK